MCCSSLNARSAELELQKAEAEIKRVQARLSYLKHQLDSSRTPDAERLVPVQADRAETTVALLSVTADRDLAKLNLESTRVKAPFDGVIGRVVGSEERYIRAGAGLATLSSDAMLALDVYTEEPYCSP